MHWTYCAQTRYGKSEYFRKLAVNTMRRRNCATVICDAPGTLVRKLVLDADFMGRAKDVIYIRLSDTDKTVGFDWVEPSLEQDEYTRRSQNEDRRDQLKSIILFRDGRLGTAGTPLIEKGLNAVLDLKFNQDCISPDYWLLNAFDPMSDAYAFFQEHCTLQSVLDRFEEWKFMSPTKRREETGPAARRIEAYFGKTPVQVHSGATFDFSQALREKKIILVDSGGVNDDTAACMEMAIIHKVIDSCRAEPKPVFLGVDEATTRIDAFVAKQMREIAKFGVSIHLLFQNPLDFATEQIRNETMQNSYHWWGRQGNPDAAQYAADDIATCLLNPDMVWYTDYVLRQIHDGYEFEKTESKTTSQGKSSKTEGERALGRFKDIYEERKHRKPYDMQKQEVKQKLMGLGPGEFYFRNEKVSPEPVYEPMLEEPWADFPGLPEKKRQKALARIKENPCYRVPVLVSPPCQDEGPSIPPTSPLDDLDG